jgi:uncharacterized protein
MSVHWKKLLNCASVLLTATGLMAQVDPLANLPLEKKIDLAKAGDLEAMMAVAEAYELGRGTRPDFALAARWYRDLALKQNLEAQFRLAKLVRVGASGLKRDLTSAVTLMTDAANKDHAAAQNQMGMMFEYAIGVEKDDAKAALWYEKAAKQNDPAAMRNLGLMLVYGRGTKTDLARGVDMFTRAAAAGDGWAMNNLGALREQGWGIARDLSKARDLYAKAAALGIPVAETNIKRLDQQPLPTP